MELEQPDTAQTRPYRSKRQRPCDLCRIRKVGCQIEGTGPCFLCRKNGVHCSYDMQPLKRQRLDDEPLSYVHPNDEAALDQRARGQQPSPANDNVATPRTDFSQYLRDWQPDHGEETPSGDLTMLMAPSTQLTIAPLPDLITDDQPWLQDWLAAEGNAPESTFDQGHRPSDSEQLLDGTYSAQVPPSLIAVGDDVREPVPAPSLDGLPGVSAQYLGLSGHTDPYLLRHFRWDEEHQRKYFKLHFRRASMQTGMSTHLNTLLNSPADRSDFGHAASHNDVVGEASHEGIPVQFALPVTDIAEAEKRDTMFRQDTSSPETLRKELFELIAPADGIRLIDLHFRFVYPWFPAASKRSVHSEADLDMIPAHLLAAIYASALPFVHHDHHLFVQNVYQKPPIDEVWHIVLEDVLREMHTPHLSVVQASLLYLQKLPRSSQASQDTPFRWSFMASVYAMACSLGLHLDCLDWTIPAWEIRLRRRLWWLVFFEEKWRSLLLGEPSLIDDDHWDVSDLQDSDFADEESTTPATEQNTAGGDECAKFRLLVDLSKLAGAILKSFYSLRASRRLQNDFSSSLQAAKPLRQSLQSWYQGLPADLQMNKRNGPGENLERDFGSIAAFHLAYLSLELLLYRAILRPLGKHRRSDGSDIAGTAPSVGSATPSVTQPWLDQNLGDLKEAMTATYAAAYNCARLWNTFAAGLNANDFGGFWYSWSRIGFAHQSNFVALLIVQAYTDNMKRDSLKIADTWRNTLRVQSRSFDQMSLGLLRLEVMYWIGFDNLFAEDG